jgi:hypothetical protein
VSRHASAVPPQAIALAEPTERDIACRHQLALKAHQALRRADPAVRGHRPLRHARRQSAELEQRRWAQRPRPCRPAPRDFPGRAPDPNRKPQTGTGGSA